MIYASKMADLRGSSLRFGVPRSANVIILNENILVFDTEFLVFDEEFIMYLTQTPLTPQPHPHQLEVC